MMNYFPKIFVIVLNYNGYDDTVKCIESLKKITYKNFDIILIDNASTDNSCLLLKASYPELKLIYSDQNKGYAGGMNIGAKYAVENNADFILLSNNDVVFSPNFIEPMIELFNTDTSIGIVSPKVLYMHDKNKIYCAGADYKLRYCGCIAKYQGLPSDKYGNEIRQINVAEGSCLLVKRDVFVQMGYMSEKYFMYFEDIDFAHKVIKKYKIVYTPHSIIYHKSGAGYSYAQYSPLYYYYFTRNRLLFFSEYSYAVKIYVLIFSVANTSLKSIFLLKGYFNSSLSKEKIKSSFKSLWLGTYIGTLYLFGMRKTHSDKPLLK